MTTVWPSTMITTPGGNGTPPGGGEHGHNGTGGTGWGGDVRGLVRTGSLSGAGTSRTQAPLTPPGSMALRAVTGLDTDDEEAPSTRAGSADAVAIIEPVARPTDIDTTPKARISLYTSGTPRFL
jgi:hypothetical protein